MSSVQSVYSFYVFLDRLIEDIMVSSKENLEVVAVVSKDLNILATVSRNEDCSEYIETAGSVIMSAVSDIVTSVEFSKPEKLRVQLNDKRYLIVYPYFDYFIVCLTKPNPRLGFVELILEYYSHQSLGLEYLENYSSLLRRLTY